MTMDRQLQGSPKYHRQEALMHLNDLSRAFLFLAYIIVLSTLSSPLLKAFLTIKLGLTLRALLSKQIIAYIYVCVCV